MTINIRYMTNDDGVYLNTDDVAAVLRAMGLDYVKHIPGHVEAGEFLECILDRHAEYILDQAAENVERQAKEILDGPVSGDQDGDGAEGRLDGDIPPG